MNTDIPVAVLAHMKPQTVINLIEAYKEMEEIKQRLFITPPRKRKRKVRVKREEQQKRIKQETPYSTDSDEDTTYGESDVPYEENGDVSGKVMDSHVNKTDDVNRAVNGHINEPGPINENSLDRATNATTQESQTDQSHIHGPPITPQDTTVNPQDLQKDHSENRPMDFFVSPEPDAQPPIIKNEDGSFICGLNKCELTYKSRASVYRHWASRHNVQPPKKCLQCPARFWAVAQLVWHERRCNRGVPETVVL